MEMKTVARNKEREPHLYDAKDLSNLSQKEVHAQRHAFHLAAYKICVALNPQFPQSWWIGTHKPTV
jgi:hypothetical protein